MRTALVGLLLGGMAALLIGSGCGSNRLPALPQAAERPSTWAQPIALAGVPNLHRVSETVLRSAQPSHEGMRNLKGMGVVTVVNLRWLHSDRDELADTSLGYAHIEMQAWAPEEEDVVRFLRIACDPGRTPVLVHCQHGADRTGAACAAYRVVVQGWTKEEAIREMRDGGYGFHEVFEGIPPFIANLDVAAIRQRLGLPALEPVSPAGGRTDPAPRHRH